jgi:competence protein ComGC
MKLKALSLALAALFAAGTLCIAQANSTDKAKAMHAAMHAGMGASDQKMVENSRAVWEAYKSRNTSAMKALTADEYVAHTQEGPSSLKQDIETIDKLTIEQFTIDEPKVTWVTKDVAILTYKCDLKGSYEGKPFKPVYATEVWVNRGGKWRIISYTETLIG